MTLLVQVSIQWPLLIALVRSDGGCAGNGENTFEEEKERVSCRADINSPEERNVLAYVQVHILMMSFLIPS